MDEIMQFVKERNEALLSHSVEKFKDFYMKWHIRGVYTVKPPKGDIVIRASMEKAILNGMPNVPEKDKDIAREWLISNGFAEGW